MSIYMNIFFLEVISY